MVTSRLKSRNELRRRLDTILSRFEQKNPDPRCELFYRSPYQLLVAVVLSAQTTDKMVNRCMEPLFSSGFSPQSALELGEDGFKQVIKSIGLAPTKARNVMALTQILVAHHHGQVPDNREALEALPGVGRKTANVVLGEIFRHPTIAVDTHVFRVSARLGLHQEKTPEKCEQILLQLFPKEKLPQGHHWLILHGRYTCTAKKPACDQCYIADLCPSAPRQSRGAGTEPRLAPAAT